MGINRKLERWMKSDLLSESQVDQIIAFERERGGKRLFNGLLWVGSFTILIGILSIVAANWQVIPPYAKVIVHLMFNAGMAAGVYIADKRGKELVREFCLVGLLGLSLTIIGLVGQVFQLNGSIAGALMLWAIITSPAMLVYGKTKISLLPWIASFIAGIVGAMIEFVYPGLNNDQGMVVTVGFYSFLPMLFILFARYSDGLNRPMLQKIMTITGVVAIILGANLACQLWYTGDTFDDVLYYFFTVLLLATAAAGANFVKVYGDFKTEELKQNVKLLLVGSFAASALSFMFLGVESSFLAAATFAVYWLYLGVVFQRMNMHGLVSLSLVMVAGRIYVVYLEVFGSLLQTGVGLIISGALLMGMAVAVHRLGKTLRTKQIMGGSHD